MKKLASAFILVCICASVFGEEWKIFEDGQSHILDDNTYQNMSVEVDSNVNNIPGTSIQIIDGSIVHGIYGNNNSDIFMTGGQINHNLAVSDNAFGSFSGGNITWHFGAYDDASAIMSGGSVHAVQAWHDSNVAITGGIIRDRVQVWDDAVVILSGGILTNGLSVSSSGGTIYLDGTNFEIDGISLKNGDKLSDFTSRIENGEYDYYGGNINGTLSDGSYLDNSFYIGRSEFSGRDGGTGDIIIIPEPMTLILMGLGGCIVIRKKGI